MPGTTSPERQLAGFLAKFSPEVRSVAKAALATMRKRLPGAIELVYDNYYALVIGFGPNERPSEAIFSIVLYPRHVSLCFLFGAELDDPHKVLQGNGNQVRHIRLDGVTFKFDSGDKSVRDGTTWYVASGTCGSEVSRSRVHVGDHLCWCSRSGPRGDIAFPAY